jgi:hypothetical protein
MNRDERKDLDDVQPWKAVNAQRPVTVPAMRITSSAGAFIVAAAW